MATLAVQQAPGDPGSVHMLFSEQAFEELLLLLFVVIFYISTNSIQVSDDFFFFFVGTNKNYSKTTLGKK